MGATLSRLYQLFSHEDRLLILIDADPDSIASALALKRLLWRRVAACVISPIRPITRPQNEHLVELLRISLTPYPEVNPGEFNRKALVDNQPGHHETFGAYQYDVIIDHHPRLPETAARFVDIRADYGANSSIMTEYLRAARIKPSLKLATALYYGITTDTANFERPAIEADVRAFHYLFKFTRRALVRSLEYAEFNISMLKYFQLAFSRYRLRHQRFFAFLGTVSTPDILVILADFFLRAHEISWTIVGGIYEDKLVVIFRNDGLRKNAGALALKAFGKLGPAGGHATSARAEVPLAHIPDLAPNAQWQLWQSFIIHRVEGRGR
ncbi:MAG: DHH family phosphoesterase [Deltaproteobacteria bacterium]|nr:DHH family phosphoesterase [Deltaproteobacteria bacterium]